MSEEMSQMFRILFGILVGIAGRSSFFYIPARLKVKNKFTGVVGLSLLTAYVSWTTLIVLVIFVINENPQKTQELFQSLRNLFN